MTDRTFNQFRVTVLVCTTVISGFVTGWLASRHLVVSVDNFVQESPARSRGDAPDIVRRPVIDALRDFQDGYTKRNVNTLHAFMRRIIPAGKDCLIMGTEPGEWIRGHERIEDFIRSDWQNWGDVRLDVDAPEISSAGDVAWLATSGTVTSHGSPRSLRFTATVVREDERWVFRQIQFQWEENRHASLRDLFWPSNLVRLRWR
jgi:hypothetical protein